MTTPLEWLTVALVLITGYYAWQSHRMVAEMKEARLAGIAPRLVPVIEYSEVKVGLVSIENLGPGPALDIDILLAFEPEGDTFRLQRYMLRPGDRRWWNPAHSGEDELKPQAYHADAHLPNHTHIHLTGTCRDLLGRIHRIDERAPVYNRWQMRFSGVWVHNALGGTDFPGNQIE